jgi:hypothetical protein
VDALHWIRKRKSCQDKLPDFRGRVNSLRRMRSGILAMADCINTVVKIPAPSIGNPFRKKSRFMLTVLKILAKSSRKARQMPYNTI